MGESTSSEVARRNQDPHLRHARALDLAQRYPHSREVLLFVAELSLFSGDLDALGRFIADRGPAPLRDACPASAGELDRARDAYLAGLDLDSPRSFYPRVLLRAAPPEPAVRHANRCPRCAQPPQCGALRPEGHGNALFLVCSLCSTEWTWPRDTCPQCAGGQLSYHAAAEQIPHLTTQTCESCRTYFHLIDCAKDPAAIPDLDELAALPLDLWAREGGFRKLHPNLAGL